jgi:hypothetical protein
MTRVVNSVLFRPECLERLVPVKKTKQNETKQVLPRLKSRPDPEFSVKFRPEHSNRIPCVPFRVKATESKSKTQN